MRSWLQVVLTFLSIIGIALAQQCGWQAGGAVCAGGLCCSEYGYCGSTEAYCGPGCQSNCPVPGPPPPPPAPSPPLPPSPLEPIINNALFDQLLLHRNDPACQSNGFYTYLAFIVAARMFPTFGTTGDTETRTREIAAFLAQTSHETTGGWPTAPDGPYSWGYCFVTEVGAVADYCVPSQEWPCVPGKKYYGRGPIQLSYNYNYGQAGRDLGYDLLTYPEVLQNDAIVSFQTALWFWMTPQSPKPSCHDVITGNYVPSPGDIAAGRLPGYGLTTNIINGGLECGSGNPGSNPQQEDRIGFYKRYLDVFGLGYGENLDCYYQRPFGLFGSEKESI